MKPLEPIRFLFLGADMSLPEEEFKARYIDPACRELARKVVAKEPLTDVERTILAFFDNWRRR